MARAPSTPNLLYQVLAEESAGRHSIGRQKFNFDPGGLGRGYEITYRA
jgi:hypothetical protein